LTLQPGQTIGKNIAHPYLSVCLITYDWRRHLPSLFSAAIQHTFKRKRTCLRECFFNVTDQTTVTKGTSPFNNIINSNKNSLKLHRLKLYMKIQQLTMVDL